MVMARGQPHLLLCVAKDHSLGDGERVVKITQGVELPLLALDGHEKLLDALEGELVALDEDPDGIGHELVRHLKNLVRERCRDQNHLARGRQVAVDVVDLLFEALREHLVRLVDDEHLDRTRAKVAPLDHVEDASWRPRHGVHARIEPADVLADRLAADARVALHAHVIAQRQHHLLRLLC